MLVTKDCIMFSIAFVLLYTPSFPYFDPSNSIVLSKYLLISDAAGCLFENAAALHFAADDPPHGQKYKAIYLVSQNER